MSVRGCRSEGGEQNVRSGSMAIVVLKLEISPSSVSAGLYASFVYGVYGRCGIQTCLQEWMRVLGGKKDWDDGDSSRGGGGRGSAANVLSHRCVCTRTTDSRQDSHWYVVSKLI